MAVTENPSESGVLVRNLESWERALFDGIDDAVFVHDLQGNILDVNTAACRRLGYTRQELLSLNTRDIDDPDFASGFTHRLEQQRDSGNLRCEGRHRTKDGGIIMVDINTSLIEYRGKPCVLAVMRDVTGQKNAERDKSLQFAIAQAVVSARSFENLEQLLLKTIAEGLNWDLAILWVVDSQAGLLRFSNLWYREELPLKTLAGDLNQTNLTRGDGLAGRVWEAGTPIWIPDILGDPQLQRIGHRLKNAGLSGAFAFPIWGSGEVTGVISSFSRKTGKPDESLLSLSVTLGSQVGQMLERQRMEQALRESQAFYHSLVESLPQNLFRKDHLGRVTFGNQRYCNLLKKPLQELIGKTDFDLFPEHLAKKYRADDEKVLQTGKPLEIIEEHRLPDGTKLFVEVIKTPIHDSAGNIIGTQGLFWDVTERFKAELALAVSERRYRQLTEATLDAIIVADQDGKITLFNPAAVKLFGYGANEVLGQPITMLIPLEYQSSHEQGMKRFLESRVPRMIGRPIELEGSRKDGTRFPLELVLTVIEPDEEKGQVQFLGAIRDLTERNRMRSILVQNEKLASIGLLSAGVAHEINNPLAFIGNNLAVLQRDLKGVMDILSLHEMGVETLGQASPDLATQIKELAEEIDLDYIKGNIYRLITRTRDGVERVAKIVQSLRGLARTGKAHQQKASLPDLVDSSLEMVRNRLRKMNIQVETRYDPDPTLYCVPTQISQVFLNLLVNAVQAIEQMDRADNNWIKIYIKRLKEEMLIQIADNGCGISPENLPQIFDPFFTTKDVGEGTGLGLSISHNIITGHGGRIEVNSTVGQGTNFRIILPLNSQLSL